MPHGRAFLVKKPKLFTSHVLPNYFKQSKFFSFTRQLNLWGFKRITRGVDAGAYYHELFLRGRPYLAMRMKRQKIKGTGMKLIPNPDAEPNFYEDWPHVPKLTSGSKRRVAAVLPTQPLLQPSVTAALPVERLGPQQMMTSRPIIHNNSGRGGNDLLNALLQQHHQLQQQLQQLQMAAAAAAGGGGGTILGQQLEQSSISGNSPELVDASSSKEPVHEINSLKFGSGSSIATAAGGRGGLSAITAAASAAVAASDSPYTSTLHLPKDITNLSTARQGQSIFPPTTYYPQQLQPAMNYDNPLQSTSAAAASPDGGMSLFDSASRYCYLEQHHPSFAGNHQGGGGGGGSDDAGGGIEAVGRLTPNDLSAVIQNRSHPQGLSALGITGGVYPLIHQQLSPSDRLLVMERFAQQQQQRGGHGDQQQDDSMSSFLPRARLFNELASSTGPTLPPLPPLGGGGAAAAAATTDGVVQALSDQVFGLKAGNNNNAIMPQPPSYPHPPVIEAPPPHPPTTTRLSSPLGVGNSSTLGNDDGPPPPPRQDQFVARYNPVKPSSVVDTLREASHLEVLGLAQRAKARSMVSGVVGGTVPTSPPEKSPMKIKPQQEATIIPLMAAAAAAAPMVEKKRPSLGRPFGRKAS